MGLTLLTLQGSRRQITAADVFRQPGLQGSGECWGLPVQTSNQQLCEAYEVELNRI